MSYYIQMQKAIDYIEDHLIEKINIKDISKVTGYSVPHVYRLFGAMVGYSMMEYVRKRRLSSALYDLMTTNHSIIDIALNFGYDSHEAFTRTFKVVYGAPPSHFRNTRSEQVLFERINLLSNRMNKGDQMIKPEIVYKDKLTLIGIKKFVSGKEKVKFSLFRETRDELLSKVSLITNRLDNLFIATYDLEIEDLLKSHDEMTYTYYYCVQVSDSQTIPEGMIVKEFEPAKYAVFTYDKIKKTLNNEKIDRPIYDYINGVWLPDSGYELNGLADYELINTETKAVDYYISIK